MNRSEFIKIVGLGSGGVIIPSNNLILSQEVKIYDNYIRGINHYDYKKIKKELEIGAEITLKREPNNHFDRFAVEVHYQNFKLGYIAAYENITIANMLDNSVKMQTSISALNPKDEYNSIAVAVKTQLITASDKLISILSKHRSDDIEDIYRRGILEDL